MLRRFEARGYRNLDTEVQLGRVNVLIGPNNSGKSNLLRAIRFIADGIERPGVDKNWAQAIREHGGRELVNRRWEDPGSRWGRGERLLQLVWDFDRSVIADSELKIHLQIAPVPGEHPAVAKETVEISRDGSVLEFLWSGGNSQFSIRGDHPELIGESAITLHPFQSDSIDLAGHIIPGPNGNKVPNRDLSSSFAALILVWRSKLAKVRVHRLADLQPSEIAAPSASVEAVPQLAPTVGNLAQHLKYLDQSTGPGLTDIADHLRELLPDLKRLFVKDAEGQVLWIEMVLGQDRVKLRELSDGTIQALVLATLLFAPQQTNLLMLDEPELNLHPAWLKVVGSWFQRATAPRQIILSTHSPDLLDTFTEGFRSGEVSLLVAGGPEGVRTVSPDEVASKLDQGWELGDLYRVGDPSIGGWPW